MVRRPLSPSLRSCSKDGITWVINCMMIDAEMYGMTPNANRDIRESAPPPNMLSMPMMPPLCASNKLAITLGSTPGMVMCEPMRNIAIANSTNSRRVRNSDVPPIPPSPGLVCSFAIVCAQCALCRNRNFCDTATGRFNRCLGTLSNATTSYLYCFFDAARQHDLYCLCLYWYKPCSH